MSVSDSPRDSGRCWCSCWCTCWCSCWCWCWCWGRGTCLTIAHVHRVTDAVSAVVYVTTSRDEPKRIIAPVADIVAILCVDRFDGNLYACRGAVCLAIKMTSGRGWTVDGDRATICITVGHAQLLHRCPWNPEIPVVTYTSPTFGWILRGESHLESVAHSGEKANGDDKKQLAFAAEHHLERIFAKKKDFCKKKKPRFLLRLLACCAFWHERARRMPHLGPVLTARVPRGGKPAASCVVPITCPARRPPRSLSYHRLRVAPS